jgi:hypothetical protein
VQKRFLSEQGYGLDGMCCFGGLLLLYDAILACLLAFGKCCFAAAAARAFEQMFSVQFVPESATAPIFFSICGTQWIQLALTELSSCSSFYCWLMYDDYKNLRLFDFLFRVVVFFLSADSSFESTFSTCFT